MILVLHMMAGAVLASGSKNIGEAVALGIVSHYFLDSLPHNDYAIEGMISGKRKLITGENVKIAMDLFLGLAIILYFIWSKNWNNAPLILTGAFFGLLPDGLSLLYYHTKTSGKNWLTIFLDKHQKMHELLHSKAKLKIATIPPQIIVSAILIYFIFKK